VANTLKSRRNGDDGFIDWLGRAGSAPSISTEKQFGNQVKPMAPITVPTPIQVRPEGGEQSNF